MAAIQSIVRSKRMSYSSGFKYQLTEDFCIMTAIQPEETVEWLFVTLCDDGLLIIKRGWAWDGPSGLTLDTKNSMVAALVHDALYALMQKKINIVGLQKRSGCAFLPPAQRRRHVAVARGLLVRRRQKTRLRLRP